MIPLQGLLLAQAPWDVIIPFAEPIAQHAAEYARQNFKTIGPRVLRDINKIFARTTSPWA